MTAIDKKSEGVAQDAKADHRARRLPPLRALAAFECASRHESFSRAAEEMSVTPSAITRQIQLLETFLGVALFERWAGRVTLSKTGAIYAAEIEHAFSTIASATGLIAPKSQRSGLVIASGPGFAAKWLQPRLPAFLERFPQARVRVTTTSDGDDLARYDVAIVDAVHPSVKRADILITEQLRPLCSPEFARRHELRTPEDLRRVTLIHSQRPLSWAKYARLIGLNDFNPMHEVWLDRSAMAVDAAVLGVGVTIDGQVLAQDEIESGLLIAPFGEDEFFVESHYYIVTAKRLSSDTLAVSFEKWIRKVVAEVGLES